MKKTSPAVGRRYPSAKLLSPRPYSMYVDTRHLKTSEENLSLSSSSSGSSSYLDFSASGSGNPLVKQKRNSAADLLSSSDCSGVLNGLVCSSSADFTDNQSPTDRNINRRDQDKKRKKSPNKRPVMQPAGPSTKSWVAPRTVKRLATPGHAFGTCISTTGNCFVSVVGSKGDRFIQSYDRNCNLLKSFPTRATKGGRTFEPYQISEMPDETLAVACGNCVTVWTKEGKLLVEHGKNLFKFAKFLAVRSTGEIIVADTDGDSVKVISAGGQQISKIPHDFKAPTGVAVDSNDNVIVATWSNQIHIFDADNELTRTFGHKGESGGEVDLPYGVCVDCEDNIVVSDMWNNRVTVYSQEGSFIRYIDHGLNRSLTKPAFISVTRGKVAEDNRLAVTDFLTCSAWVFLF